MRNASRILIATDRRDHARLILQQLQWEFEELRSSTDPALAAQEFEDFEPDVLVLAFDRLAKAQDYCLALYGTAVPPQRREHRTVILCGADECATVVELCRQEHFDDYVLYWPQAYDGFRLAMSIRIACREAAAARPHRPRPPRMLEPAHPEAEIDRISGCELDDVDRQVLRIKDSLARTRALVDKLRLRPVVMIVEDDEFARELVSRTLDPLHWDAVFAADGAAAISQLDSMRPDVILMDIRMPGVDGVSLTRQLKSSPHLADIPVVMMTGDGRKETLLSSLAAGAVGFVVKPFTRAVVTAKLQKVLSR